MDRLETRELVYFVAVAEHLHFGRAAEHLGIAQPPLSRAISRLERRVGVRLLERTSRSVALTPSGDAFLTEARIALGAMQAAVRRAQRAAHPGRLHIAVRPGTGSGLVADILREYERGSGAQAEILFTEEQAAALRDGTADVALLCEGDDVQGLRTAPLVHERDVALFPAAHPMATSGTVISADLVAEPMFRPRCPAVGLDEIVDLVALGRLIVVVGESAAQRLGRGVTAVPVADAPGRLLSLGWAAGTPPAVRDVFLAAAQRASSGLASHGKRPKPAPVAP